ncbi:MAG: glmU [Gammaproteobacteria bacterium]|jgi:bifunctional UDP-N-acetylglucosamine pyrophosphorylase/glucosamine-1-phosphate N-acetyltransferase|nr:glmU [Gammaproteobacteria bacterium]
MALKQSPDSNLHNSDLHIVILAAGAGTRMRSSLSKVLHPLMDKPMLQHVIDTAKQLQPKDIWLIYGHQGEQLKACIQDPQLHWIEQAERLGTGHALQVLYPSLIQQAKPQDKVLIISADSPALSVATLQQLIQAANQYPLVLLNIYLNDPTGFGRIVRNAKSEITHIVEHKDTDEEQVNIKEIYSGIMLARVEVLSTCLKKLTNNNSQKEYYLTQLIELCFAENFSIGSVLLQESFEARGINDRLQLAEMERYMQRQAAQALMLKGVTIKDPARFDVRGNIQAEQDITIDINCLFEGNIQIGTGTTIGANCVLKNCRIGKNVTIHPFTMIDDADIADNAIVGPFARLRPGTVLEESVHIGNFVEVKKSRIGKKSKANHLSYIGDASIGENVNIGAGTITCNYDGVNKHQTIIKDGAFIGSNTALVAPVEIGENATIGAGSTINKNAPAEKLSLARTKQMTIDAWKRPKGKSA